MKWNELIGQERARSRLDFYYDASKNGEALPAFMFCAPRGFGKTTIAESFAERVRDGVNGDKKVKTVNAASIKNMKQFWDSICMPVINDRDVTIHFDEASELPLNVQMFMLSMVIVDSTDRTVVTYNDMPMDVDLRRQTFLFSTTEPHKIFPALMNRCRRIDLEDYSYSDLNLIMRRNAKGVKFSNQVLGEMAPVMRGAARQAVMMAKDVKSYLAPLKKDSFIQKDWEILRKKLDLLPLGLSRGELQVLRILKSNRDCSLTRLAATLGKTPESVRRDVELYLQKQGLLEVATTGRNITPAGIQYLNKLDGIVEEKKVEVKA